MKRGSLPRRPALWRSLTIPNFHVPRRGGKRKGRKGREKGGEEGKWGGRQLSDPPMQISGYATSSRCVFVDFNMEVPSYDPEQISVLLSSMIFKAVPALLDQHDRYDVSQLVKYLAKHYLGIPAQMRAPVAIADDRCTSGHVVAYCLGKECELRGPQQATLCWWGSQRLVFLGAGVATGISPCFRVSSRDFFTRGC